MKIIINELDSKKLKDHFICNFWYKKYKTNELVDIERLKLIECMIKEQIENKEKVKNYVKNK